ncbi:hypothetical protein H4R18_003407 [Coemansia javaensis]|uniref:Mitochondrial K+-H+ exchange-related-domain-containing protein n=1 Tax=Coemansia javaensis TaxID=2761396 RepID=A0A9W8LIG0_9FUNG|nr:hypothetical protein H4R18_003407 [Coemansia javaensis]
MRIYVIPITAARWALHCSPVNATPTRMTRLALFASSKWSKWAVHPRDSWRGRIYAYGESLMDRIDFREYFLKEIPSRSEGGLVTKVDIVAPSLLRESAIVSELRALAQTQEPYHGRWLRYCCYLLPLSSLFTAVPLIPNFPLFYNLFRVYSHYKARHGAQHLLQLLDGGAFEVVYDAELSRWYEGAARQQPGSPDSGTLPAGGAASEPPSQHQPSASETPYESDADQRTLEDGRPLLETPVLITDGDISRMAAYLQLPLFEPAVRRARHQIIAGLAKPPPPSDV